MAQCEAAGRMLRDLLKRITAKAARIPPEAAVPSHRKNFGLIDVEYFVQAEPSFDLRKYCGYLAPSMSEQLVTPSS